MLTALIPYVDSAYTVYIDDVEASSLANVLVQEWDTEHAVDVKDSSGETVCSFTYSVLSYVYTVLSDTSSYDADVVSLVQAMYLYWDAAVAYAY